MHTTLITSNDVIYTAYIETHDNSTYTHYHTYVMVLKTTKHLIVLSLQINSSCKCALAHHLFCIIQRAKIFLLFLEQTCQGFW